MATSDNEKKKVPFSAPWGGGGILWRTALFLLGMLLLSLLFMFLRKGNLFGKEDPLKKDPFKKEWNTPDPFGEGAFDADSLARLFDEYERNLPPDLRDDSPVEDWFDPIDGVRELPDPEHNRIPPVDSTRFIPDPRDSLSTIVSDQLIVFFNSQDLEKDMADFARQFKALYPGPEYEISYYNPEAGTMLLTVPQDRLIDMVHELPEKIKGIDFVVTTNEVMEESAVGPPSDPDFAKAQFDAYFKLIQTYEAWEVTKGSPSVKVAIVDSYFDLTHPEIGDRYTDRIYIPTKSRNVLPPAVQPESPDQLGSLCHGSHVAGIAIGGQDNGLGCSGIAPGCTWIPVALGDQMTSFNVMEGILYAVYRGADVVNISLGRVYPEFAKEIPLADQVGVAQETSLSGALLWEYIINTANAHNCVIVTAAGNNSVLMGMDPKNRSNAFVKVEAVDEKGQAADFTNYGRVPEANLDYSTVSAPGVNIWSATDKRYAGIWEYVEAQPPIVVDAQQGFQTMSGTSMASPVVAGAVALLKSKNKDLTTDQVIKILTMTAKQFDTEHRIGPTIQIRDALDATGGEMVNFDDIMKDHSSIIGKWRSTHELSITQGDVKVDDIWTYFIFETETSGYLEHHAIGSKRIYTAALRVDWLSDSFTITQLDDSRAADGDTINKDFFRCHADSDGLLSADCYRGNTYRFSFQLEKVH